MEDAEPWSVMDKGTSGHLVPSYDFEAATVLAPSRRCVNKSGTPSCQCLQKQEISRGESLPLTVVEPLNCRWHEGGDCSQEVQPPQSWSSPDIKCEGCAQYTQPVRTAYVAWGARRNCILCSAADTGAVSGQAAAECWGYCLQANLSPLQSICTAPMTYAAPDTILRGRSQAIPNVKSRSGNNSRRLRSGDRAVPASSAAIDRLVQGLQRGAMLPAIPLCVQSMPSGSHTAAHRSAHHLMGSSQCAGAHV